MLVLWPPYTCQGVCVPTHYTHTPTPTHPHACMCVHTQRHILNKLKSSTQRHAHEINKMQWKKLRSEIHVGSRDVAQLVEDLSSTPNTAYLDVGVSQHSRVRSRKIRRLTSSLAKYQAWGQPEPHATPSQKHKSIWAKRKTLVPWCGFGGSGAGGQHQHPALPTEAQKGMNHHWRSL